VIFREIYKNLIRLILLFIIYLQRLLFALSENKKRSRTQNGPTCSDVPPFRIFDR
jgi:hypothetical protein